MSIRSHPNLRLSNDAGLGVTTANGQAVNSRGVRGPEIWGKCAKWVDYWGVVGGLTVGIAILDHPLNSCHPTWWYARSYGLIAANPFGMHAFESQPEGTGNLTVSSGESITFRYRFVFHKGDTKQAHIAAIYEKYARTRTEGIGEVHDQKSK